jgi:TonB family protein
VIRVIGQLPAGSVVLVDGVLQLEEPTARLPVGRHSIGVSAPGYELHEESVTVSARDTTVVTLTLTRSGTRSGGTTVRPRASSCEPGPAYDRASCFDSWPKPSTPPFVPVPAGAAEAPSQSVLWVQVSADGRTRAVRAKTPSDDPAFERAAREFARGLSWEPALKDGVPVDVWIQLPFRPAPR